MPELPNFNTYIVITKINKLFILTEQGINLGFFQLSNIVTKNMNIEKSFSVISYKKKTLD